MCDKTTAQLLGILVILLALLALRRKSTTNQAQAQPLSSLFRGQLLDSSANWVSATYGNGYYVIVKNTVGGTGVVTISNDGINWTEPATSLMLINSIAFGPNTFVAVGSTSEALTSNNGRTWSSRPLAATAILNAVAYGNGLFVAVGQNGAVATTNDGRQWTNRISAAVTNWRSVVYGPFGWVAVSSAGIMRSTNGIAWTLATSPVINNWNTVTYGNGFYITAAQDGSIAVSGDGESWFQTASLGTSIASICCAQGTLLALAQDGRIWRASQPSSWTQVDSPLSSGSSIAFGDGMFVAVGPGETVALSGFPVLQTLDNKNFMSGDVEMFGTLRVFPNVSGTAQRLVDIYSESTISSGNYYAVDINPVLNSNTSNQRMSIFRLRDRGANVGGSSGQVRMLLTSENAGGGQHSVNLFESALVIGRHAGGF